MTLEWRTTKIGNATVVHWKKIRASEVLAALELSPILRTGRHPFVYLHEFGPFQLASRDFSSFKPGVYKSFDHLKKVLTAMVEQRAAIVEMPVAFVNAPKKKVIVSMWKKGTSPLSIFLDSNVSIEAKKRTCLTVARKLAKLHAAGFVHRHLTMSNVVVDRKRNAHFIDYTRLSKIRFPLGTILRSEDKSVFWELTLPLSKTADEAQALQGEMEKEYSRFYEKYKARH